MANNNFAVFILTHGRPDKVITYSTLRKQGYTGKIVLVVDNEDDALPRYRSLFGDQVVVFDKKAAAERVDVGDNFKDRRVVVYARNISFQIAEELGLEYFLMLDDDYGSFAYKFDSHLVYRGGYVCDLDTLFSFMLSYFESIPALTLAFAQNGDFIGGGAHSPNAQTIHLGRKAMNTFFCSTSRPFEFFGRINEDVNAYVTLGNRGGLFFTVFSVAIGQNRTQSSSGGLSDVYLDLGTYVKSFYTVMYAPSCTKITDIGPSYRRIHHKISWNNAVPKILGEWTKKGTGVSQPARSLV